MAMAKEYKFTRTPLPLPYDLLHLILQELISSKSYATLSKLSTLSREHHALITPLIYTHVHVASDDQLQRFLTLPHTLDHKGKKIGKTSKALSVLGVKRGRSGSIKSPVFKLQSLSLLQSLTLDVYPSRASLKLASKLPGPLPATLLTFTPKAVLSLHSRLGHSNAPAILPTFWATHLPSLIRPSKVVVDYSTLDVREMKAKAWVDTMGGMSVSLQAWTAPDPTSGRVRGTEQVELRGGWWTGILPGTGVKVDMVHTALKLVTGEQVVHQVDSDQESILSLEPDVDQDQDQDQDAALASTIVPISNPVGPGPVQPAEPDPLLLQAMGDRNALISERIRALTLALSTSQAMHDTSRSPLPLRWTTRDLIPPPATSPSASRVASYASLARLSEEAEEERRAEVEVERREVVSKLMGEVDNTAPGLGRYAYIDEMGRRGLSCLVWE